MDKEEQIKICKHCGMPLNEIRKHIPKVGLVEIGRAVYHGVLDNYYKSINLCNFCYSVMQAYRHTLSKEEREREEQIIEPVEPNDPPGTMLEGGTGQGTVKWLVEKLLQICQIKKNR